MRRKTFAASVIVLSLVLLIVGVAASETNRPLFSGQSGTFTFTPLAVGDQAEYSVEVVDKKGNTVEAKRPLMELQWTNVNTAFDHEGRERHVAMAFVGSQQLGESGQPITTGGITWAVELGTWDLVHYAYLKEPTSETREDKIYEHWSEQRFFVDDELFLLPCAMSNRLAGQTIDLKDTIDPMQHCSWHDYWSESNPMKAIETSTFDGRDAVTFRNAVGTLQQVTFADEFSFPVQLVVERQDDRGTFHVIRLESFRAGTIPIPTTATTPGAPQFQELALTSWDRYPFGILEQPYRLDDAVTDAQNHAEESGVRDWMANHPAWFVASATNLIQEYQVFDDHKRYDTWNIALTDGVDSLSFVFDRIQTTPEATTELPDAGLPVDQDPTDQTTTEYSFRTLSESRLPFPSKSTLGDLPRAVDIVPRWKILSGGETPNSLQYHIQCISTCEEVYYQVGVGEQARTSGNGESESSSSKYVLSFDGRADIGFGAQYLASYNRWSHATTPTVGGGENEPAAFASTWTSGTDEAAVALGSLGLFGGLVGLLGPTIRNIGLVRLFSRIRHDRLLEHPQRQRIMQAIYAEPGVHMRALRQRLDLGSSVTDHHVRKMEQAGLIQVDRRGSYVCLFPQGHMDHSAMAAVPAMKAKGAKAIVTVLGNGPTLQADLPAATGLSKGTLSYHLGRLIETGAVEAIKDGRSKSLHLTPLGQQAAASAA